MCCCNTFMRCFFGVTLIFRAIIHLTFAYFAANDLIQIQDGTSWASFVLKSGKHVEGVGFLFSGAADLLTDTKLTLLFYIMCGLLLFLAVALFPWRNKHRPRLPYYSVIHVLFVGMVVYMVYLRGLIPLKYMREVYKVAETPYLFPISLVLDAMTILSACVPPNSEKPRHHSSSLSNPDVMPLVRGEVFNVPTNAPHRIYIKAYP